MTSLRLPQRANDSVSGALEVVPAAFISWNTGDSASCRRMYTEMASSTIETRNGMRQPQVSNSRRRASYGTARMTSRLRNRPSVAVVWIQLV